MISSQLDADSRILINRDIESRAAAPLPFLTFDDDPYMAVTSEGYVWIWDAYTTSDAYPYSQAVDLAEATADLLDPQQVNYMRNSVKAVVDAYDGSVTYYADLDEPMMQAWDRAFPGVFTSIDDASEELRNHFRYPENLFQVQAFHFANYHVEDPAAFYRKQDFWEIPNDPTVTASATQVDPSSPAPETGGRKLQPNYLLMRLPGEDEERFHLVVPFQPEDRLNMVGWMAANSDPDGYGELVAFTFPSGRDVDGPGLVFSRINSDKDFSEARTLLGQGGSEVQFGDLLDDPHRGFDPLRPADVRAREAGGRGPRAEARDGRERLERLGRDVAAPGASGSDGRHDRRRAAAAGRRRRHGGRADTGAAHPGGGALHRRRRGVA